MHPILSEAIGLGLMFIAISLFAAYKHNRQSNQASHSQTQENSK